MDTPPKTCLLCEHCRIDFGCGDYSDVTPGDPLDFRCYKGHWDITQSHGGKTTLRSALAMAETCKDFELEK